MSDDLLTAGTFRGKTYLHRVTMRREVIVHRGEHDPEMMKPLAFVRHLLIDESCYRRNGIEITAACEVDSGFLTEASYVCIRNETRWLGNVIPTPKEQAEVDARILLLGPPERPDWLTLRPGEQIELPAELPIMATPAAGPVTVTVLVVPR